MLIRCFDLEFDALLLAIKVFEVNEMPLLSSTPILSWLKKGIFSISNFPFTFPTEWPQCQSFSLKSRSIDLPRFLEAFPSF
jgi:hypothetical protein